ncbi:MAG: CDP-2,3-bis-(O-geranylgeranyl)-sn-glycerol synthase [Thermoproteota archaeon]|jgi:CDP-2,3-bis-(O-geranylgeranyl)-sn-glycerol synthase|nr:CDP-2,3-bis-(O-geranylgeranyl)-sn-glycerol synthase [Thermoproteota archaeon]
MIGELIIAYSLPLVFLSPAYAANASPLFLSGLLKKLHPLDLNKKFFDGQRILGDGKTIEGTAFGFLVGIIYFSIFLFVDKSLNILHLYHSYLEGLLIVSGAMIGDIIGSFVKRRLKMKQGDMLPVFDQVGFVIFAYVFYLFVFPPPLNLPPMGFIVYVSLITFFVHILTNLAAFKFGIKYVPY